LRVAEGWGRPVVRHSFVVMLLLEASGCAHRSTLADRLAHPELAIEVEACAHRATLVSPELERQAGGGSPGPVLFATGGLGGSWVLLPLLVVGAGVAAVVEDSLREEQLTAWRRLSGNETVSWVSERTFLAAVSSQETCRAAGEALRQGVEEMARSWGHRIVQPGRATPLLRIGLSEVTFTFRPGVAPVRLAAVFEATLLRDGRQRSLFDPAASGLRSGPLVADPEPALLRDLAADEAALAKDRVVKLARRFGAVAAAELVVALGDLPREKAAYDPPVCGLGPVDAEDGAALQAGDLPGTLDALVGEPRPLPVPLDMRSPVLAWEHWRPRGDELPANALLTYELRLWRSPRGPSDTTPLVEITGLASPSFSLEGRIEPDRLYDWSVRALVEVPGGGRFAMAWSFIYPRTWERSGSPEQLGACLLQSRAAPAFQLKASSVRRPEPRRVGDRPPRAEVR
jgi:hypothetical protein